MKILFAISTDQSISSPTMGSERQFIGYATAMANLGHEVYVSNILKTGIDDLVNYDICHMVNASGLKGPYILLAKLCNALDIPTVITPVFWPLDEEIEEINNMYAALGEKRDSSELKAQFDRYLNGVVEMVLAADWIAPNSYAELLKVLELCCKNIDYLNTGQEDRFGNKIKRYSIINNGIDVSGEVNFAKNVGTDFDEKLEELLHEKFVLCVGRIETRKNQANLILAMEELWAEDPELQLVLMGERSSPYIKYVNKYAKGRHVLYCPPGPPAAVMKMMRRATCHALPSFVETPGLVNLEAAALDKPIVVGDRGSVREYFGNAKGVSYCDPQNPHSIAAAIKGAMGHGEAKELGQMVREKYSYETIAKSIENMYNDVINFYRGEI